jgi:hypothetical protein
MTDALMLRIKALELALEAATSYPPPHIAEQRNAVPVPAVPTSAPPDAASIVASAEIFFTFLSP